MNAYEFFMDRLEVLKEMNDIVIIMDSVEKISVTIESNCKDKNSEKYNWILKREKNWDTSVSKSAFLNNDNFVKIEHLHGRVFLIKANQINFEGKIYIIEVINDITTNSSFVINNEATESAAAFLSEINERSIKDYLTGIYNRRYIDERLPIDIENSIKEKYPISIVMADIDYFKKVNDNYGHLIGDNLLRDFSKIILKCIRKDVDWAGRYGGEEFIIVLKDTDIENAYIVAEKIRKMVENTLFGYDAVNVNVNVTSSFGVHECVDEKLNLEDLILQVDKKLYLAKKSGRNKTIASIEKDKSSKKIKANSIVKTCSRNNFINLSTVNY